MAASTASVARHRRSHSSRSIMPPSEGALGQRARRLRRQKPPSDAVADLPGRPASPQRGRREPFRDSRAPARRLRAQKISPVSRTQTSPPSSMERATLPRPAHRRGLEPGTEGKDQHTEHTARPAVRQIVEYAHQRLLNLPQRQTRRTRRGAAGRTARRPSSWKRLIAAEAMYSQATASARRPLNFSRRLNAPPRVAERQVGSQRKGGAHPCEAPKIGQHSGLVRGAVEPARAHRPQQSSQGVAGKKRRWRKKIRSKLFTLFSRMAVISSLRKGWQRIAPWPKMISERVKMLAPSTVMPIGTAT